MKKSEMAELTLRAQQLEQMHESALEKLVDIIQSSFSAVATSDPGLALNIIRQLEGQKDGIQQLAQDREMEALEYIKNTVSRLPDTLIFEEELDNEDMN